MLKVLLNRLKHQAVTIIAEQQAGFRPGRSITEQILNLRILCDTFNINKTSNTSLLISKGSLIEHDIKPFGHYEAL